MTVVEKAVQWAIETANDNRHGYSQVNRWGETGDYDCSSFVISAYRHAGLKLTGATYTGNMRPAFLADGFVDVSSQVGLTSGYGIIAGDVLLNYSSHTCLSIGNGKVANCRTDEGHPQPGDQGQEIRIQNFWSYPWNCCLRYKGKEQISGGSQHLDPENPVSGADTAATPQQLCTAQLPVLLQGDKGVAVERLQTLLIGRGYYCGGRRYSGRELPDGDFGPATAVAVRDVQLAAEIARDGIVGADTWAALIRT